MKILIIDSYDNPRNGLRLVADSAWRPDRRPLFIPEGAGCIHAEIRPAVRISRLGKSISPDFAGRYYDAWTLVSVQDFGQGAALMADDSMVVGRWLPLDVLPASGTCSGAPVGVDIPAARLAGALAELSRGMTFKTGDILVLPDVPVARAYRPPMAVEADVAGSVLNFNIR